MASSLKEQPKTTTTTSSAATTVLKMSTGSGGIPSAIGGAGTATTTAAIARATAAEAAASGNGMNHSNHNGNSTTIGTKPTLIEVPPMRFLIMDAPRQSNLHVYIKEMRKHQVSHVVRVCEPTYMGGELQAAGIDLHEMEYKDGTSPSKELIFKWLKLVEDTFYASSPTGTGGGGAPPSSCIAVHCVAGLGRAPVLVALALIELHGMDPVEAVTFLRQKRRGAINEKQLLYLEGYKKQYKKTHTSGSTSSQSCCVIL